MSATASTREVIYCLYVCLSVCLALKYFHFLDDGWPLN